MKKCDKCHNGSCWHQDISLFGRLLGQQNIPALTSHPWQLLLPLHLLLVWSLVLSKSLWHHQNYAMSSTLFFSYRLQKKIHLVASSERTKKQKSSRFLCPKASVDCMSRVIYLISPAPNSIHKSLRFNSENNATARKQRLCQPFWSSNVECRYVFRCPMHEEICLCHFLLDQNSFEVRNLSSKALTTICHFPPYPHIPFPPSNSSQTFLLSLFKTM